MPTGRTRQRPGPLRIVWALALGLAIALGLSAAVRARGDDATEARHHAQRASNLAASGKCRQAVAEFDKALAILRDPALLFNRAECHRKLGDKDAALEDYRQFLSDMPKAPNRAEVERRIAELSAKEKAGPPAPVVVAAPVPVAPPPQLEPRPVAEPVIAPRDVAAPPPALPVAPAEPAPSPALALALADTAPAPASSEGGITTRPWFWITVAAVAVAVGVGTFVLLSRDSTSVPSSSLGNYKF